MSHTYDVGTRAWQPDAEEGWIASEVEQKLVNGEKVKLVFRLENGEVLIPRSGNVELCTRLTHAGISGESYRDHAGGAARRQGLDATSPHESYRARGQR